MRFHPPRTFSASLARLLLARRPDVRLTFSFPRLVRVLLVALLLAGFALGAWSGVARAATRALPSPASMTSFTPQSGGTRSSATTGSSLPSNFVFPHTATATNPYDTGLGVLPFYTYIHHPLNTCACGKKELLVNVATGNLVLQSVEMQIHGTGEDLSLDAYYNSQPNSNTYQEMGTNWNLSLGRQVYLDTSTSYTYDGAGNRTSATSHGITTTYSYNSADELVSSLVNGTTTTYSYDGNGNQLTGAGRTFSINNRNQTTGISSAVPAIATSTVAPTRPTGCGSTASTMSTVPSA